MTTKEAQQGQLEGKFIAIGTYMGGKASTTTVRAGAGQQGRRTAVVVRETVLVDGDFIVKSSWLEDGKTVDDFKPAAKKGEKVAVCAQEIVQEAGTTIVRRGEILPLTA